MTVFLFQKNAGEKLSQTEEAKARTTTESPGPEQAILDYIASLALSVEELTLKFDRTSATITVTGKVPDQTTREKIILCCGNVEGIERVDDQMKHAEDESAASNWYTVKPGDTLPDISQKFYLDAQKFMQIFAANEPMMDHPDKIYPGQMLRIPQASRKCAETTIIYRKNSFIDWNR